MISHGFYKEKSAADVFKVMTGDITRQEEAVEGGAEWQLISHNGF